MEKQNKSQASWKEVFLLLSHQNAGKFKLMNVYFDPENQPWAFVLTFHRSNRGVSVLGTLLTHLVVSFSILPQPNARNLTQRVNRNCTVVMSSDPFTRGTGFIKPSFQARLEIRVSPESVEFTLICGGSALLGRILRLWSFFFFNCRLSDYLKCWYFINEPVSISGSWFFFLVDLKTESTTLNSACRAPPRLQRRS